MRNIQKRYKYGFFSSYVSCVGVLMTIFGSSVIFFAFQYGNYGVVILFSGLTPIICFATIITILTNATIEITNNSISCYKFGYKLKTARWNDVKKIRKFRFWSPYHWGRARYCNAFFIYDNKPSLLTNLFCNLHSGPIKFDEYIRNLPDLLDQINAYAQQYGIPLVVEDEEAASKLAAQEGASYWKQRVPKAEEVRVDRL